MVEKKRDIERNRAEETAPEESAAPADGAERDAQEGGAPGAEAREKEAPEADKAGGADPSAGAAAEAEDPAAAAERRIAELEGELASLKDNALRAMAEAENVRKRAERQAADAAKYGAVALARDMLTISDNLRRALEAAPADAVAGNELLANLRTGVEMIEKELQQMLQRHGVEEVTPRPGDRFDHNVHQAMFELETEEHAPGTVAQVLQAGYRLHDRLLRAAMVGVAKAPAGKPPAADGAEEDSEAAAADDGAGEADVDRG